MVCVFPTRQETAGAHSNQGFGVGISRRSNRRADYNDDSRYSVRSLVDQSRRNAEGLRCQPRSSSNCFQRENRLADRHLEFEQDARNPPVFTLCPWILNSALQGKSVIGSSKQAAPRVTDRAVISTFSVLRKRGSPTRGHDSRSVHCRHSHSEQQIVKSRFVRSVDIAQGPRPLLTITITLHEHELMGAARGFAVAIPKSV